MTSFRNGPKSGEKTAANGAAPHFRNERNFFWAHSPLYFFVLKRLLRSSGNRPSRHTPRENFEAHSELGRDISSNRTVPDPLCAISHIDIEGVAIREKLSFLGSNLPNSSLEFSPEQILG